MFVCIIMHSPPLWNQLSFARTRSLPTRSAQRKNREGRSSILILSDFLFAVSPVWLLLSACNSQKTYRWWKKQSYFFPHWRLRQGSKPHLAHLNVKYFILDPVASQWSKCARKSTKHKLQLLMGGVQMMRSRRLSLLLLCDCCVFFVASTLSHVQISRTLNLIIFSALPSRKFFCTSEHMPKAWDLRCIIIGGKKFALA